MSSPSDADLEELAKLKLPLVQKDYESYFAATSRYLDQIKQVHTFEVTLVAGLIALTHKGGLFQFGPVFAGIIIIAGAAVVEARLHAAVGAISFEVCEIEQLLHADDLLTFRTNIVRWEFGNTRGARLPSSMVLKRMYWAARKPGFWLWHLSLAACLVAIKGVI